jgi:hypothetical protein
VYSVHGSPETAAKRIKRGKRGIFLKEKGTENVKEQ